MKVKVLKLGYAAREIEVSQGITVEESIRASGMEDSGFKITVNGVGADLAALVRENDVICLVPKVDLPPIVVPPIKLVSIPLATSGA